MYGATVLSNALTFFFFFLLQAFTISMGWK